MPKEITVPEKIGSSQKPTPEKVSLITASPEQQIIINENVKNWQDEDALRQEIARLGEKSAKRLKKILKAEKTDPPEPLTRATGDYNEKTEGLENFEELYLEDN